MIIEYLSASRLDVYMSCPFRYFLQYHLKLPELKGQTIATHKGSAVHEALELHVKGEDYEKVLKDYYAQYKVWEFDNRKPGRGFPHPVEKKCDTCQWAAHKGKTTTCSIAQRLVTDFDGCPKPNFEDDLKLTSTTINKEDSVLNRKIIGAEVPFNMTFDKFKVRGFMDLVTEVNETTMEVLDYKTGNYTKNGKDAFKDLQMRIYSMVAKILYPQYDYVLMTLYYLRKRPVTVIFSREDDEKTKQFLGDSYEKIIASIDPPRQKSFKCTWCVGYEECGKIREKFLDGDGNFCMPEPSDGKDYQKPKTRLPMAGDKPNA
jgi:RecB family exonuclease